MDIVRTRNLPHRVASSHNHLAGHTVVAHIYPRKRFRGWFLGLPVEQPARDLYEGAAPTLDQCRWCATRPAFETMNGVR